MVVENQTPTYNLKAVVRETGLKPDTLRAWERRYNLPQPQRTAGGHRLYSQRDIDILKWLVARQTEGLSISRAVNLWRHLEAEDQDPLQTAAPHQTVAAASPTVGEAIDELRNAWVSACLEFDEQRAEYILTQAFALYPPEFVCIQLLLPGLAQIGQSWYQGEVTVQQEHFASALSVRRLEVLLAAAPSPTRPDRLLVGCPPEEEHIFSPLLLTLLLRRQGWDVIYLGANVPLDHLETTIASAKPSLVIFSAQQLPTAASLLKMARRLQPKQVALAYGGRIFNLLPDLRRRIPGHFLGERLDLVPQRVEQLLTSSVATPPAESPPEAYQQALKIYRKCQALIEADVWRDLETLQVPPDYLNIANSNMARYIVAALTLGDMDFLETEPHWLEELLINHELSSELVRQYLDTYYQAAESQLNAQGEPILIGLNRVRSTLTS